MKRIVVVIALTLFWISAPGFAADAVPPQKRANILRLLNLTLRQSFEIGAAKSLDRSLQQQGSRAPDPASRNLMMTTMHEILDEEFNADRASSDFVGGMVDSYNKGFSDVEIQQMLVFYSSSVGQRATSIQTSMGLDNADGLHAWALNISGQVLQRVAEKLKATKPTPPLSDSKSGA